MVKEGGTKELEVEEESKTPKAKHKWRNFFIIILSIIVLLVITWFALTNFRQNKAANLINQAQNASDQKQRALDLYKAKLLTPASAAPYFELGKLASENENYNLAQKYFVSALKRDEKDKQTYFYLINSLINQGKIFEVDKYMEKLEILDPNDPEIVFLKTRVALNGDQVDKAKELLKTITDRDLKYEKYYDLILLSEGNFAIIDKSSNEELNSLTSEIKTSQNPIFVKTKLGLEWLKLQEKNIGCKMIKEAKEKDTSITQKLNTYQKLFNTCNL